MTDIPRKVSAAMPLPAARALADVVAEIGGLENYSVAISFDALRSHRATVSLSPGSLTVGKFPIHDLQAAADRWIAAMHAIGMPPLRVEFQSPQGRRQSSGSTLSQGSVYGLAQLMRRAVSAQTWTRARQDLTLSIRRGTDPKGRLGARLHGIGSVDPGDARNLRIALETWSAYRASWFAGQEWLVLVPDFHRAGPKRSPSLPSAEIVDLLDARCCRSSVTHTDPD